MISANMMRSLQQSVNSVNLQYKRLRQNKNLEDKDMVDILNMLLELVEKFERLGK
ncbi:MAG TPA: hypothetical protein VMW29_03740 [Candidatus Bathyarchaeia archaeon]|nr:hypothetical protein [Candidatus Bathyarchaeia archaeon]